MAAETGMPGRVLLRLMDGFRLRGLERVPRQAGFCYTCRSVIEGLNAPGRARSIRSQPMFGEWLSLVEHLVRDQGVGGSNPLSPTNKINNLQPFYPD